MTGEDEERTNRLADATGSEVVEILAEAVLNLLAAGRIPRLDEPEQPVTEGAHASPANA